MKNFLTLSTLSLALMVGAQVASAQMTAVPVAAAPASITFPIAELGGCTDRQACHAYCESTDHIVACAQFAADHKMISQEQANKAKEFKDAIAGGGPGGCTDQKSCAAYCEDLAHADACFAFAETHNLIPAKDIEQAKKVAKVLHDGGHTPGACKDKASCEAYCADTSHVDECLSFAAKANLMTSDQVAEAQKVAPFLKRGETPGKCTTKDSCAAYCADTTHFDECISFAEKASLVSKEDAVIARKAGGVGPGGCTSKDACEAYCNAPANAQACLSFAKEKGILSADKVKEIEDGMGRLRTGLKQMPPEMVSCLTDALGADTVAQLEAGTLTPGPDIGSKVKECADSFAPKLKEKMDAAFGMATPQVLACMETAVGKDRLTAIKGGATPTASEGDQIKKCFETMRTEGMKQAQEGLSKMPAAMRACVEAKLGADTLAKIQAGDTEALGPESARVFKDCAASMQKGARGDEQQTGDSREGGQRVSPEGSSFETPPAVGTAPAEAGPAMQQGPSCDAFKSVPSCDLVPEGVRSICRSCKQ